MAPGSLLESIEKKEELIKRACSLAMKAHTQKPEKPYLVEKTKSDVVFAFAGSWSLNDWFAEDPFGKIKINFGQFRSLRSVGIGDPAEVNRAFLQRFERISKSLEKEVDKYVHEQKRVVFTGHSSGGPIAILAAIRFLEKKNYPRPQIPLCVTFGSPLTGDRIFSHALRRENWSDYFINFVTKYDIVPLIPLAPLSSIDRQLKQVLLFLNPHNKPFCNPGAIMELYVAVMRSASAVASHAACKLMGSTSLLLDTALSFTDLSPYRPFGTYVFCSESGKMVVLSNPDAVLQLLFYSFQVSNEAEMNSVASKCRETHLGYGSLEIQNMVYLDDLEEIPLSLDIVAEKTIAAINMALNDLGLSTRAKLCLRAAGALEKKKRKNQEDVDGKKDKIKESIRKLENYREKHSSGKLGYYDAFKLSAEMEDFQANVERMQLAGMWDEIIEMLKRYELPDEFEGNKEWIELGTRYRRLVEPLDIANYYRHLKNEDTGPYSKKGRPKRYRFTQRWREYIDNLPNGSSWESCVWAEVEEHCINTSNGGQFENAKENIERLERELRTWIEKDLFKDIICRESTFSKWWRTLPTAHRSQSCIASYMNLE